MPDDALLARIDDADGVDSRLGHQQPAGFLVVCHPDGQHAAQRFQARNANGISASTRLAAASITVMESSLALETNTFPAAATMPDGLLPP